MTAVFSILAVDVRQLFTFPFMINAFEAGTVVAIVAGLVGWFMVLRRQTFAGHTLAVVGFPGASGATYLGIASVFGFFAFCLGAAALVALAGRRTAGDRADPARSRPSSAPSRPLRWPADSCS